MNVLSDIMLPNLQKLQALPPPVPSINWPSKALRALEVIVLSHSSPAIPTGSDGSSCRIMEPAAVLVTGICELFDMYFLAVFRSFSDIPLTVFIPGENVQVLHDVSRCRLIRLNASSASMQLNIYFPCFFFCRQP